MRIHYLQHVPFEDLGMMEPIFIDNGHPLTSTKFYKSYTVPSIHEFDCLIVMGGPMGVNDEADHPWLHHEKKCEVLYSMPVKSIENAAAQMNLERLHLFFCVKYYLKSSFGFVVSPVAFG